jgi:DNA polymerase III subunit alpha
MPIDETLIPSPTNSSNLQFAHLHQHTAYSLLDGAARIKDLMKWVKQVSPDKPTVAMTDHGNMHGAVEFYKTAVAEGVKPIIGFEAYVVAGSRFDKKKASSKIDGGYFHLTLLAKDFKGYQNLCKLNSRGWLEGFYSKPRVDHELLREYSQGVVAMSGCLGAQIPRTLLDLSFEAGEEVLKKYLDIYGDSFFIELQDHGIGDQKRLNPMLKQLANKYGLGMVASNDGHYVRKEDARAHEALLAIQTKTTLSDPNRFKFSCDEFYVKTPEEMGIVFPENDYPSALSNSLVVADLCDITLPIGDKRVYQMPVMPIPEGRTLAEQLRVQTYQGLMQRYSVISETFMRAYLESTGQKGQTLEDVLLLLAKEAEKGRQAKVEGQTYPTYIYTHLESFKENWVEQNTVNPEALKILGRAEFELGVIAAMGFPDYFLIVADFINWAKNNGIAVGPGRGSGAGSIVAYATRITNIDPLAYDLLFERFLNPDRVSMPDFDVDFSDVRRMEVVEYVRAKYGEDKVSQIATFGTMASRAAIKDAARVLEASYADADAVSKLIPVVFGKSTPIAKAMEEVAEIKHMYDNGAKEFMDVAMALEGLTRHASVHAAGVIIAREPIQELAPVFRSGDGPLVCQYDMGSIEELGFLKMDFLGLRTLSFIEAIVRIVRQSRGIELNPDEFPMDDPATFELLSRGEAAGVFQFESTGMVDTLRKLRPTRVQDLIAVSALYRPGPMENIPIYIRRHHKLEEVRYEDFPKAEQYLAPILEETYGIPVYQEQIMQIAQAVAGYSLGQADILRRAMGKKKVSEMEKQRKIFTEGAASKGIPASEAGGIFDLLEKFANYGFNKSHSAAYGVLSYQTAYLKTHYPVEFAAALLTVERANSDKVAQYVNDARHLGIPVLSPDINESVSDFTPVDKVVRFGLYGIKNVGDAAVEHILQARDKQGKFKGIWDFCQRIDTVNKRALEHLIKAGAFEAFGKRNVLLANLEMAMKWGTEHRNRAEQGQMGLFGVEEIKPPALSKGLELTNLELLKMEKDALGLYISSHPMQSYSGLAEAASCSIEHVEAWFKAQHQTATVPGSRIKVALAGILQNVVKRATKSGTMMANFEITDETGSRKIVAFSRTYEQISPLLVNDAPAVLVCEQRDSDLIADRLIRWDNRDQLPEIAVLEFELETLNTLQLNNLRSYLDEYSGIVPVYLRIHTPQGLAHYETEGIKLDRERLEELQITCPWLKASITLDTQKLLRERPQDAQWYKKTPPPPTIEVPF